MGLSDADGQLAVRLARLAIEAHVAAIPMERVKVPAIFREKRGAFVTLNVYPNGELRGCIGYPEPFFPLLETIVRSAEGATEDPRFSKLQDEELDRVAVEVSVLTPPELIEVKKPRELAQSIRIGDDGLKIAQGQYRGILLPQVAIEWNWDAEAFLSEACMKAGLLADAWLDETTRVYKFQAEIFSEQEPRGPAVRRNLSVEHARH